MTEAKTEATEATEATNVKVGDARPHNDFKAFIEAWESSDSVQEAADKLGIGKSSAGQRASAYRNKEGGGIPLKKMPRGGAKLVVSDAQNFLETLRAEQAESDAADEANAEADAQVEA